jgi:hypothetical protein
VVSGIAGDHTGVVHMNRDALPDISVTLEDGRDLATALANHELGNADYGLHYIGLSGTDVTDEVTGATLSGKFDVAWGPLQNFEFGVSDTVRKKERNTIENDTNGGSCQYCNMYDRTFASLARTSSTQIICRTSCATPAATIRGSSSASTSRTPRASRARCTEYLAEATCRSSTRASRARSSTGASCDVEEDTTALYLQATKSSAGSRIRPALINDTTTRTAVKHIVSIVDPTPEVPTSSPITYRGPAGHRKGGGIQLRPVERRLGNVRPAVRCAARVIARPP